MAWRGRKALPEENRSIVRSSKVDKVDGQGQRWAGDGVGVRYRMVGVIISP